MTAPVNPADVPHELIEAFERAALMSILHEDVRPSRYILAAVIPAIRAAERAQVADEIEAGFGEDAYDSPSAIEVVRDIVRFLRGDQ